MQKSFDCLCFLDNNNLCIFEIARPVQSAPAYGKSYEWLLLQKSDMSISSLSLKSRDDSFYVQERYFNLGYLKYNQHDGIFIERSNTGQHPLENRECTGIPENYLQVVEDYLKKMVNMPSLQEVH